MTPDTLATVELLVKDSVANELRQKGLAEIALRRVDQKFRSFVKCRVIDNAGTETAVKIMDSVLSDNSINITDAAHIRNVIENLDLANKRLPKLDLKLKDLSSRADSLLHTTQALKNLSFINTGLTLTNVAVNAVGFYVINERIKGITGAIGSLEKEIATLKEMDFSANFARPAEELQIHYGFLCDKLKTGKTISLTSLETYMGRIKPFLSTLIDLLPKPNLNTDALLNIIFSLFPVYTSVLSLYLKAFYIENHQTPTNYDNFLSIFEKLNSSEFYNAVLDCYFLNGSYTYKEVSDIINVESVLLFNERLQIDDMIAMLDIFDNEEAYQIFDNRLNGIAEQKIQHTIKAVSIKNGLDEKEFQRILEAQ